VKSKGYKQFLKQNFKLLKAQNTQKLIVDLRGNGGGKDRWGAWLCRYLINQDFHYFEKMEARTKKFDFKDYSSNKGLNMLGLLFRKDKKQKGLYQWTHHQPLKKQQSSKYAFDGKLILLIDGGTFSTAADVASVVSSNTNARFIGEEAGGGYYGNTSAISYSMQLKNSKIWYYIPVVRYSTATSENRPIGHGITPDITLKNGYEDWTIGRDVVLELAKNEIQ
jgi:C-terminal processing protease CtpA/Prc